MRFISAAWAGFASLYENNICELKIMFRYFLWMTVINGMLVQNILVREMKCVFGNVWGHFGSVSD